MADFAQDAPAGIYEAYNDIKTGQQAGNYQYDKIGNLIKDDKEDILEIDWTVYGKIKQIRKRGGILINYRYDAAGNRIFKREGVGGKEIWYVRDASGNVMSVYTKDPSQNSGHLMQSEIHLYGSSRLGILNTNVDMEIAAEEQQMITFTKGNKFFELAKNDRDIFDSFRETSYGEGLASLLMDFFFGYFRYSLEFKNWEVIQKKMVAFAKLIDISEVEDSIQTFLIRLTDDFYLRKDGYSGSMDLPMELISFLGQFERFSEFQVELDKFDFPKLEM